MHLWVNIRIALRALRTNILRSALTMLGILIGVGAVIAMVTVASAARTRINQQIQSLGANLLAVFSKSVSRGGVHLGQDSRLTLTEEDAMAIAAEVPRIMTVSYTVRQKGQIVAGNLNRSTHYVGSTPEYLLARDWIIERGRQFNWDEVERGANVVVLGQTVVEHLFSDQDPIGQIVRVKRVPFTVIGILKRKGYLGQGWDQDDVVMVPITTAKVRLLGLNRVHPRSVLGIQIKAESPEALKQVEEQAHRLLRQRHGLQEGDEDDFRIKNYSEMFEVQEASSQTLTLLLAAVAAVSLLVGGVGIMNTMLVSITERTREIGLRIAVGAREEDILAQFLIEAVTLALLGGVLGVLTGVATSQILAHLNGWSMPLQPGAILIAVSVAAVVGIASGLYPARKAARLTPIDALRHE